MDHEDLDELGQALVRAIQVENERKHRMNNLVPWVAGLSGFVGGLVTMFLFQLANYFQ